MHHLRYYCLIYHLYTSRVLSHMHRSSDLILQRVPSTIRKWVRHKRQWLDGLLQVRGRNYLSFDWSRLGLRRSIAGQWCVVQLPQRKGDKLKSSLLWPNCISIMAPLCRILYLQLWMLQTQSRIQPELQRDHQRILSRR